MPFDTSVRAILADCNRPTHDCDGLMAWDEVQTLMSTEDVFALASAREKSLSAYIAAARKVISRMAAEIEPQAVS